MKHTIKIRNIKNIIQTQCGSVLIMAIIISSGIMVVGTELALLVVNSIKQGRNSDFAVSSQYGSEAAIESALHQYRQEELDTLRKNTDTFPNNTSWTLANIDGQPKRERSDVDELYKSSLVKSQSMVADLYTSNGTAAVTDIHSIKFTWQLEENCPAQNRDAPPTWPEIEVSAIAWSSGTIQWSSDANVKKALFYPAQGKNEVVVDLTNFNGEDLSNSPLIVQIQSTKCDLRGVSMTLHKALDATDAIIPIPNYHLIKPAGSHNTISRENQAIIPNRQTHSDVFGYTLFSECDISKTPTGCQ